MLGLAIQLLRGSSLSLAQPDLLRIPSHSTIPLLGSILLKIWIVSTFPNLPFQIESTDTTFQLGGGASEGIPRTVACMREKSFQEILGATGLGSVSGQFVPTVDNEVVFANYTARAAMGRFIRKPYLTGNNDYEVGLFKVVAALDATQLSNLEWAIYMLVAYTCPAADAALQRAVHGVPTWRYRYFGEFPNVRLTLYPNSGAWHGAETAQIFQTAEDSSGVPNTPAETAFSDYIQGAWAAFAKHPARGLSQGPYRWPRYNPASES